MNPPVTIVDSHAHLDMPAFDADRDEVMRRARDAGVMAVVSIATAGRDEPPFAKSLALAGADPAVYAGVGIHPHDARLADDSYWTLLEKAAAHARVCLLGEIGLDYYYNHSPRDAQQRVFRRQLQMAAALGLPVAVHCRDAWEDLISILRSECGADHPGGILHSFTGDARQAAEAVSLGFMISFSGIVTFSRAETIRAAALAVPQDKILFETDSPYLAPVPHRGKRNEPACVVEVARFVARLRGESVEGLAAASCDNLRRLTGVADFLPAGPSSKHMC